MRTPAQTGTLRSQPIASYPLPIGPRLPVPAAVLAAMLVAVLLVGCQRPGDAADAGAVAGSADAPAASIDGADGIDDADSAEPVADDGGGDPRHDAVLDDQPAEDVPPATASGLLPPPSRDAGPARVDGYGPLRIGMSAEQMAAAWTQQPALAAIGEPAEGSTCYYLRPGTGEAAQAPAFMLEEGRFVRYDVSDPEIEAPGGGRVGVQGDAIRALYAGRYEAMPHKYVEGGQYLRVTGLGTGAAAGDGVLVFVVGADGRVNAWRAGRAPQVDYVEGCS